MRILIHLILTATLCNAAFAETGTGEPKDITSHLVDCNTQFAFNLYGQLKDVDGNLFISPFSISTAMAMTYAGARGQTAEQMRKTLCIHEMFRTDINPNMEAIAYDLLIDRLNQQGQQGNCQLSIANALWAQKGYPFLDTFIQLNSQYYHAGLENVDFINETEKSRQTINQWVEDKTQDKIKDLISPGALNAMTRLVLTNAIYFKGTWANQFNSAWTEDANFFVPGNKPVTVSMMTQKANFNYAETDTLQIVELPYIDNQLSMVVLLPKAKDGIAELEKQLTGEKLIGWYKQMQDEVIIIDLPHFEMMSKFSLAKTLAAMGMPDAFSSKVADFSYMIDSGRDMMGGGLKPLNTNTEKLYISDVIHKAFVSVGEKGTEAAAATAVIMMVGGAPDLMSPPIFRADHPFVFLIKDNKTSSILFIGRVLDPTKAGQ